MSGTYRLDGRYFTVDPIAKRWSRQPIASIGTAESIYSSFWQCELSFGALEVVPDVQFFQTRWLAGGLHTATLPHPTTGELTGFTGTNIQDFSYEFNDVDSDSWGEGARMVISHINLSATGTIPDYLPI